MIHLGDSLAYEPYRDRRVDRGEVALVYRNLMRRNDGVWWSIVQRGLVVGHARHVVLRAATFVVRVAGRDKVRATGVKNVHAFVRGYVDPYASALALAFGPPASVWYNPRVVDGFVVGTNSADARPELIARAAYAVLSSTTFASVGRPTVDAYAPRFA